MKYISAKDIAEKWDISQRRVLVLCENGRIDGVSRVGNMWLIPADAVKPQDSRIRDIGENSTQAKPFLKWAGGKKQLLPELSKIYPFENKAITKYAEPFVGGGAVLFDILNKYQLESVFINDLNQELINCYQIIKTNVDELIADLEILQNKFLADNTDRQNMFTLKRSRFNELKKKVNNKNNVERASLMIFLNRTCFNGLYRENSRGDFNVPIGSYKHPLICDKNNLKRVSGKLQNVTIKCGDYRDLDEFIDEKTFVYFDPPYRPLNITSSFTAYTKDEFNDENQVELAKYFAELSERGAKVALSNSDPKNTNPNDDFFDNLYAPFKINRISANRMINSKASKRGKLNELLITN